MQVCEKVLIGFSYRFKVTERSHELSSWCHLTFNHYGFELRFLPCSIAGIKFIPCYVIALFGNLGTIKDTVYFFY